MGNTQFDGPTHRENDNNNTKKRDSGTPRMRKRQTKGIRNKNGAKKEERKKREE